MRSAGRSPLDRYGNTADQPFLSGKWDYLRCGTDEGLKPGEEVQMGSCLIHLPKGEYNKIVS